MSLTKQDFAQQFTALCEVYDKEPTKALMEIYFSILQHLDPEVFKQCIMGLLANRVYPSFPKPAEILESTLVDTDALVLGAWSKLSETMARVGAYESVLFDDPIITRFIEMQRGGWQGLCQTTFDDMVWVRKDFEKFYVAMVRTKAEFEPKVIPGIHEGNDTAIGLREFARLPHIVGNREKVLKALENFGIETDVLKQIEEGR